MAYAIYGHGTFLSSYDRHNRYHWRPGYIHRIFMVILLVLPHDLYTQAYSNNHKFFMIPLAMFLSALFHSSWADRYPKPLVVLLAYKSIGTSFTSARNILGCLTNLHRWACMLSRNSWPIFTGLRFVLRLISTIGMQLEAMGNMENY